MARARWTKLTQSSHRQPDMSHLRWKSHVGDTDVWEQSYIPQIPEPPFSLARRGCRCPERRRSGKGGHGINSARLIRAAFNPDGCQLNVKHAPGIPSTNLTPVTFVRVRASEAAQLSEFAIEWVGYTHVRLASLPDGITSSHPLGVGTTPMEIARFYVARKWHGQGVASAMLATVVSQAQTQGAPTLWLSVWQANARAIAFYQKSDFVSIGTGKFLMGEDLQDDFIMERAVGKLPTQASA
jgi:ribosomal protein S18 acetylase RimI-like enzyme